MIRNIGLGKLKLKDMNEAFTVIKQTSKTKDLSKSNRNRYYKYDNNRHYTDYMIIVINLNSTTKI